MTQITQFNAETETAQLKTYLQNNFSGFEGQEPNLSLLIFNVEECLRKFKNSLIFTNYIPLKELLFSQMREIEMTFPREARDMDKEYNALGQILEAYQQHPTNISLNMPNIEKKFKKNNPNLLQFLTSVKPKEKTTYLTTEKSLLTEISQEISPENVQNKMNVDKTTIADEIVHIIFSHIRNVITCEHAFEVMQDVQKVTDYADTIREGEYDLILKSLNAKFKSPFAKYALKAYSIYAVPSNSWEKELTKFVAVIKQ